MKVRDILATEARWLVPLLAAYSLFMAGVALGMRL